MQRQGSSTEQTGKRLMNKQWGISEYARLQRLR